MSTPKKPDGFGALKSRRLQAKRDKEAREVAKAKPATLNPPFPFKVEPFDAAFFRLL